jgi:putative ubiquitin-RnfH superfamily antitoxin RatB of RatAB toxin-antitoxin module
MKVTVVWATSQVQDIVEVELPAGSSVADAVAQSGLVAHHGVHRAAMGYAVFGRRTTEGALLADGDRVELTRPLEADPAAARAIRAQADRTGKATRPAKRPRPPPRPR